MMLQTASEKPGDSKKEPIFAIGNSENSPKSPISPVDSENFSKYLYAEHNNNNTLPISKSKLKLSSYRGFTVGFYEVFDGEENVIGKGTYGVVLKGVDKLTRRKVAVKKLSGEIKIAELKILEELKSPWIVSFLGVYAKEKFVYFVMELCDCDLKDMIANEGSLSIENLDILTGCIARGYNVLYQLEIIHRDIKPQNILILFDKSPQTKILPQKKILVAKLTDFGISREVKKNSGIALRNLAGTLAYMAPEVGANIVDSNEYNVEVDMWSIGVLLHESITGKEPFDERAICKLFLYSCNRNFGGYHMPKLPNGTPDKYVALIDSLLTLDCTKRLQPTQFYNVVVKNYLIHKTNDGRWKIDLKQTTLSFSLVAAKAFNYVFSHKVVCLSAICLLALLYKKNQL